ncbi:hypothetical protein BCR43DRAFT_445429, partial [Syncephalastrum racemosum]
ACSRLLAGMIVLHTASGMAIAASTIEVSGRRRTIDSYRESFRTKLGVALHLLPPEGARYPYIRPTSISNAIGMKLLKGAMIINALVTLTMWLDKFS